MITWYISIENSFLFHFLLAMIDFIAHVYIFLVLIVYSNSLTELSSTSHEEFLASCNFSKYTRRLLDYSRFMKQNDINNHEEYYTYHSSSIPQSICRKLTQKDRYQSHNSDIQEPEKITSHSKPIVFNNHHHNNHPNPYQGNIPIYWINLDKSVERRITMEQHLNAHGYKHQRMKGYTLNDIYIPSDVNYMWTTNHPVIYTKEYPPPKNTLLPSSKFYNYSIVLSGLWGRRKNNRIKEVGCTISHLMAIYHACKEAEITGAKYALIMEDDVFLPFQVNFTELIASAPSDFGILQAFNSNEESMENLWRQYKQYSKIWMPRYHGAAASFWSTCAYIIDINIMRERIHHIVKYLPNGWIDVKLISMSRPPKIEWGFLFCEKGLPTECCFGNSTGLHLPIVDEDNKNKKIICTYSPRGYQADSYLYALTKTYVITTPMITNGITGNQSTFHQDHVANLHHNAFIRQRTYMNDMFFGKQKIPPFAKPLCSKPLPIPKTISRVTECHYKYLEQKHIPKESIPIFYHIINPQEISTKFGKMLNQKMVVEGIGLQYKIQTYVNTSNIVIPTDILSSWNKLSCQTKSTERMDINSIGQSSVIIQISGLCGRGESGFDTISSLVSTVNHLLAIYHAIHDESSSSSPYAIISDDSIASFPLDINYTQIVQSASIVNPKWGILQLSSTYDDSIMTRQWLRYIRGGYKLWTEYYKPKTVDAWPWKTYLISKEVLRPVINAIVKRVFVTNSDSKVYDMRIIASYFTKCIPSSVCNRKKSLSSKKPSNTLVASSTATTLPISTKEEEEEERILIDSPNGFSYDVFIPSLSNTLVSTIPHFKAYKPGLMAKIQSLDWNVSESSFHNTIHHLLVRQNEFIASMLEDRQPMPFYATKSCVEYLK